VAKIISLSSRLQKPKASPLPEDRKSRMPPAQKPTGERLDLLEKNTWTIVEYVEELEDRLEQMEKRFLKLLRLLQDSET